MERLGRLGFRDTRQGPTFRPRNLMAMSLKIETHDVMLDSKTASGIPNAHAGKFVCLSVNDSGHGMSPGVLRRSIEPFFSTKEPGRGTGVGLSSVYGFVRQSGGFLSITSEVNKEQVSRYFCHARSEISSEGAARAARSRPPQTGVPSMGWGVTSCGYTIASDLDRSPKAGLSLAALVNCGWASSAFACARHGTTGDHSSRPR